MTNEPVILFNGDKIFIDELDSLRLREKGIYEKTETEFIQSFVKPNMVCVDIGANIGYYTIMMARLARHVYAFEPDSKNFDILLNNIKLNDITNVISYPFAIGQTINNITLHKCLDNNGMNRVYPSKWCKGGTETVPMVTLDSIVDHADFIKMDIEGAEYGALLGMRKLLEKGVTLMMEFNVPSIIEYGKEPKEVFDYMVNLGYDISFPDRPLTWNELNELGTKWAGINIICTPKK